MYKYYVVLVCVQVKVNPFTTNQNNEILTGWFKEERAALGEAVSIVTKKHPQGAIVFTMVNDCTEVVRNEPFNYE